MVRQTLGRRPPNERRNMTFGEKHELEFLGEIKVNQEKYKRLLEAEIALG